MPTMKPMTPLQPLIRANVKPTALCARQLHQKRPLLTRKGDGGFNPTHIQASKGDTGFTREFSDARELLRVLINTLSHAIPPLTVHASACNR